MTRGDIGSIGLWFDIFGAFFLAESFVTKKRAEIARETGSYYDRNPFLLRSYSYQAIEARVGFSFLLLGFVCQLFGQTSRFRPGVAQKPMVLGLGAIIFLALIYFLVEISSRHYSRRMIASTSSAWNGGINDTNKTQDEKIKLALYYGIALDLEPMKGEKDEDFIARLTRCLEQWGHPH